ncbi:MAG: leukotriene A4 hydrolase C-terminal domain-containing protein, partial [Bacteroidetes bacterium]|nr:leukotriene A4 hydrolase C-terminal domain-containing protein [Bacteroidota bacterium]
KFLMPLYEAMTETEEGTEMAKEIYRVARQNYHPIAILSIDKLLKWEPES